MATGILLARVNAARRALASDANAKRLDDPQVAREGFAAGEPRHLLDELQDTHDALSGGTKYHDSVEFGRRMEPQVRKAEVERDQGAALALAGL